ncbi:MAG TPA: hypothetical protein VGC64_00515 [Pyrinomonadaceae bacterium]
MSTLELLEAWERGLALSMLERALMLLSAWTGTSPATVARLSIGQRDCWLLKLREAAFGSQLSSLAQCPACGEQLETTFNIADLRVGEERLEPERASSELAHEEMVLKEVTPPEVFSLVIEGCEVSFRLPNSLDLLALTNCSDAQAARRALFARFLLRAARHGEEVAVEQLSENILQAVEARVAQIDPQADVRFALNCPRCAAQWEETFDISSFFWTEITAWATRLLGEVHTLARAYGWRERDILEMSAQRREFYLNAVAG